MKIFKSHQAIDVISQYVKNSSPLIVEVGAFHGHDTVRMVNKWPTATIHAFEPMDELYEKLVKKTNEYPNIQAYQLAVSDTVGKSEFYVSEKPEKPGICTQAGSLRKPKERLKHSSIIFPKTAIVDTITLDAFVDTHGIAHIDLLWLDTQGHEFSILQAATRTMAKIDFIFMEVSFIESYEGQVVYPDIISWMEQHGFYTIARDFENISDWFFGNVLLQRKV